MPNVDTNKYLEFVDGVTSQPSKSYPNFTARVYELNELGFPTERLLTAAVGMCAEAGEFTEIVKKITFQGKPVTEENLFHLKRELGDIINVSSGKQLQTRDIVVNMDGGVGGSWKQVEYIEVGGQTIPTQQNLPESNSKPIDLK